MKLRLLRRHPRELALDGVFFVWISYVLLTGNLLPGPVLALLDSDPPTVAISEPSNAPVLPGGIDVDVLPET